MMRERSDTAVPTDAGRSGFSLIELIIALLILAVGILAMAATTGYLSKRIRSAELRTERAVATRTATERVRGIPFNVLDDRPEEEAWQIGDYDVFWQVRFNGALAEVTIVSRGPGVDASGRVVEAKMDTTFFSVAQSVWN